MKVEKVLDKMSDRLHLQEGLPGVVCSQWRRCGKDNCRCATGLLHGPYFTRMWREGGRLRSQYISREDLEEVRAQCQREQVFKAQERRARQQAAATLRRLRQATREAEATIRGNR
jgi:hypothetical protein